MFHLQVGFLLFVSAPDLMLGWLGDMKFVLSFVVVAINLLITTKELNSALMLDMIWRVLDNDTSVKNSFCDAAAEVNCSSHHSKHCHSASRATWDRTGGLCLEFPYL